MAWLQAPTKKTTIVATKSSKPAPILSTFAKTNAPPPQEHTFDNLDSLGKFSSTMSTVSELALDPLSLKANPKKAISDYWHGIKDTVVKAGVDWANVFDKNKTKSEKLASGLSATAGTIGAVISPITSLFASANDIPVVGTVSRLISLPFEIVGDAGHDLAYPVVASLPISKQAKRNIVDGVGEIFSLAGQFALPITAEKLGAIKTDLVKKYGATDADTIIKQAKEKAKTIKKPVLQTFAKKEIAPVEVPKVDIAPIPEETKQIPTLSKAKKMITKEGGVANATSIPAVNAYASAELSQSLGLNEKYLYEHATKQDINLGEWLKKFDRQASLEDRAKVRNDLIEKLSSEAQIIEKTKPKKTSEPLNAGKEVLPIETLAKEFRKGKTDARQLTDQLVKLYPNKNPVLLEDLAGNAQALRENKAFNLEELQKALNNIKDENKDSAMRLFRGSKENGKINITDETKSFERILDVKNTQEELLKKLEQEGVHVPSSVWEVKDKKVRYSEADPFLRDHFKDRYDAIRYNNENRPEIKSKEIHDLKTGKFHATNRDYADLYARQNRGAKYDVSTKKVPLKPVGEGEVLTSKLAKGVEEKAIAKKLTKGFGDLPEYQKVNLKEQARLSTEFFAKDPEKAFDVAMGIENPPEGILPEMIFSVVEENAIKNADIDTLRQLANSELTSEATAMGQRIRALAERNPESPVVSIQKVEKGRLKNLENKLKGARTVTEVRTETMQEIKKSIKKRNPRTQNWAEFIKSIEC